MINKQDKKVELVEKRNKEVEEDLKDQRKISIGSIALTVLLILL